MQIRFVISGPQVSSRVKSVFYLPPGFLAGLFLCLLFLPFITLNAAPPEPATVPVQHVSGRSIQLMNSKGETSGWWITSMDINPERLSEEIAGRKEKWADLLADGWIPAVVPGLAREAKGFSDRGMQAWYCKVFFLEKDAPEHLAIDLGYIDDSDETFLNGVLIGKSGSLKSANPIAYDNARLYELPNGVLRRGNFNVLLVHVRGYFPGEWGMTRGRTAIGEVKALYSDFDRNNYIEALFLVCYFTVGSYFFFLFVRRRNEIENLLFGVFAYVLVAYQFLKTQLRFELGIDFIILKRFEFMFLYLAVPVLYYFIRSYFSFPRTKLMRAWDIIAAAACLVLAGCLVSVFLIQSLAVTWTIQKTIGQPAWIPLILGSIGLLTYQALRGSRDGLYMLGGFAIILIAMILDILSSRGLFLFPRMMSYFFLAFVMSIALVLANRFVRLSKEVEDLNANLEQKVKDRTNQLKESLDHVRSLKEQQDGDYFLTSLLLAPLSGDTSRSDNVHIDFRIRQKKEFSFKKWNASIGGDICAAHTIRLMNRPYIVFLNGDAMGKSIQGAGGALVLGTVFKAMITRTQMTQSSSQRYPEQWLKECFHELQSVFVSFNGSMLVSVFIGLIDEEKGALYYLNAEHPQAVLYRDGKADFMDNSPPLRKIGIEWQNGTLHVRLFQLKPNDVLIVGSDGRDDLSIGTNANGERVMNEDESVFLRAVETAQADLMRIENELIRFGSLTDDLSLIRIGFKEDAAIVESRSIPELTEKMQTARALLENGKETEARAAYEEILAKYPGSTTAIRALIRLDLRAGAFDRAADLTSRYLEMRPLDTEYLYFAAVANKGMWKGSGSTVALERAAELGERCRIRNPAHLRNLVNLADIYRLLGNRKRALHISQEAALIDPVDASLVRLGGLLETEEKSA